MQAQTGTGRVPRSTLSDALKRFDPEALRPTIEGLIRTTPALKQRDADLQAITRQVIAADGSSSNLAGPRNKGQPRGRRAVPGSSGEFRGVPGGPGSSGGAGCDQVQPRVWLNLHLDVRGFSPTGCGISGADERGEGQ